MGAVEKVRASALAKIAQARRLLDEGLRELADADAAAEPANDDAEGSVDVASAPRLKKAVQVSDTDRARARKRLRARGVRV